MFNTSVKLLATSIKSEWQELPEKPTRNICAVTGIKTSCLPRKFLLGASFTNYDLLRFPNSEWVSVDVYQAMKYKWQRMSCWWCDGKTFERITKPRIRQLFLKPIDADFWCGYVTTSYKKHGVLRTPVNHCRQNVWLFEMELVDGSNYDKVNLWYDQMCEFYRKGISRSSFETLDIHPAFLRKVGVEPWLRFKSWATHKQPTSLYRFLSYLLPTQEEIKNELAT
jgi:hypothetical protein